MQNFHCRDNVKTSSKVLNFVENLLQNEGDPRSRPMNDQDHSLVFVIFTEFSLKFSHVSQRRRQFSPFQHYWEDIWGGVRGEK
jgi:hypothetical protein